MTNEISEELIERALQLTETGRSMYDYDGEFPYPKFFYYLLDRQFLIKYYQNNKPGYTPDVAKTDLMAGEFGYAIMEYQSLNPESIISLLSKIGHQNK